MMNTELSYFNDVEYRIAAFKLNYRAMIPFHILLDDSLSANELRLYGIIEQLESSCGDVYITDRTIAYILGVNHEAKLIQRMARNLKLKKYIKREEKEVTIKGRKQWLKCWTTVKAGKIIIEEVNNESKINGLEENNTRGVPDVPLLYKSESGGVPPVPKGGVRHVHLCKALDISPMNTAAGAAFSAAALPLSPITPVELIAVYHEVLPDNPRVLINPVTGAIEPKVNKAIRAFKKYWKDRAGSPITIDDFKTYMMDLRNNFSRFTLDSYIGKGGNEQKNGLAIFLKWETVENVNANKNLY